MEVSISSHEVDKDVILKEMQNGKILHLNNSLSFGSDGYLTETPYQEQPDLVPTQDNISSDDKVNTDVSEKQETDEEIVGNQAGETEE